jgi:hypothetical protein
MDYLEASGLVADRSAPERVAVVCGRRAADDEPVPPDRRQSRDATRASAG